MLDIPAEPIDWRSKGFWLPDRTLTAAAVAAAGQSIFDGGFIWPLLVVKQSAVQANIATMAAYCARHGLDFAPHAKTSMAPGLIAAQLDAGAWGMTVATANQALVLRRLGVPRVFIANQVLDPTPLRWLADQTAAGWEVYFQVDSAAGVGAAADALDATGGRLLVFVELGHPGGRTGCRTVADLELGPDVRPDGAVEPQAGDEQDLHGPVPPSCQKYVCSTSTTRRSSSTTGMCRHLSNAVHGWEIPNRRRSPTRRSTSGAVDR